MNPVRLAKELRNRAKRREAAVRKLGRFRRGDVEYDKVAQVIMAAVLDELADAVEALRTPGTCRVCGCTDGDCSLCVARTGVPCHWVEPDLCSACVGREGP